MSGNFVYELMKRIKVEATDEKLCESFGVAKDTEPAKECMQKPKEKKKVPAGKFPARREGRIPNLAGTDGEKIKALREEDDEVILDEPPVKDEVPAGEEPKKEEPSENPIDTAGVEVPEKPTAGPDEKGGSDVEDLVANMAAAKEHYEKGNYKVAEELLKLIQDTIKDFKEMIKVKKDEEKAAEAPRPEPGEGTDDKKNESIKEQTYTTLARGISDEEVAKRIAQEKKGVVVKDDTDDKKFMVIMKESFTRKEVEKIVTETKKEAVALQGKIEEKECACAAREKKAAQEKEELEKSHQHNMEESNMILDVLSQVVTGTSIEGLKNKFDESKKAVVAAKKISGDKLGKDDWKAIMEQVISGFQFTKKQEMLESLAGLYGMQQVHIDEQKSQLLSKLLKTKE